MPVAPPAAKLTLEGCCSDCGERAVPAASGNMLVCPNCYSLLWHVDWKQHPAAIEREKLSAAEAKRAREARRAKVFEGAITAIKAARLVTEPPNVEPPKLEPKD